MDDIALRKDILEELEFEPSVNARHIGVAVSQGIVTLTGHGRRMRRATSCAGFCPMPAPSRKAMSTG